MFIYTTCIICISSCHVQTYVYANLIIICVLLSCCCNLSRCCFCKHMCVYVEYKQIKYTCYDVTAY